MMASRTPADLIARSNQLGADPKNTNYAGGNTSAKGTETCLLYTSDAADE